MIDTSRLLPTLQLTGLAHKNQPLYQLLNQLIGIETKVAAIINAAGGIGPVGPAGADGKQGIPGIYERIYDEPLIMLPNGVGDVARLDSGNYFKLNGPHQFGPVAGSKYNTYDARAAMIFIGGPWNPTVIDSNFNDVTGINIQPTITMPGGFVGTGYCISTYIAGSFQSASSGVHNFYGLFIDSPPVTLNGTATADYVTSLYVENVYEPVTSVGSYSIRSAGGKILFDRGTPADAGGQANPSLYLLATWNDATKTYTHFRVNVTDTNSNIHSMLMRLQKSGTDVFSVEKNGVVSIIDLGPDVALRIDDHNSNNVVLTQYQYAGTQIATIESNGGTAFRFNAFSIPIHLMQTNVVKATLDTTGRFGIGITPTAFLHLLAGTAAANTAPIKLTSGTLLTSPEAGAIEFLTDAYYGTITTGVARKTFAFREDVAVTQGSGKSDAQTGAVASVTAFTVGASNALFLVGANINVTTSTLHNFTCTVSYTDETSTARVLTLNFSQLTGAFVTAITNATGAGAYEGIPLTIRAKNGTTITIATTGTFTTVTYNIAGFINQVALT